MPDLFEPVRIGNIEPGNRFVHSATFESMAEESGEVTDGLVKRYARLAKGEVGLIIPGALYVHPRGRVNRLQAAVYDDRFIPGLRRVTGAVHENGGKIVFQVVHSGGQTSSKVTGGKPLAPSGGRRDPVYLTKPEEMSEERIREAIGAYVKAAVRVAESGADGIQIHAAHGILMNQFLSPFFNRRTDRWGGSEENMFRFMREVVLGMKKEAGDAFPVLVKLTSNDYTPRPGITPELARIYAGWLSEIGVDAIEISCGTGSYSNMNIWRGDVPVKELVGGLPSWKKPFGWLMLKRMEGKFDLVEGYNLEAARIIKPAMGETPLILVGGLRNLDRMKEIVGNGDADLVSMCRPFIREPGLVRRFREGKTKAASCVSCNKCLAATINDLEVRCYYRPGSRGGKERE